MQRDANEKERARERKRKREKEMEKVGKKKKGHRMLRTVRFSVKFPEKYELLPEKETSFVQRG